MLISSRSSHQANALSVNNRYMALTFDDVPATASNSLKVDELVNINSHILSALRRRSIPATAFVNGSGLHRPGILNLRHTILSLWSNAGQNLGNHTYSHTRLSTTPFQEWKRDVLRGAASLELKQPLRNDSPPPLFQYPYLDMGNTIELRSLAASFLASCGYTVAPVSIDASDWKFAKVYDAVRLYGDKRALDYVVRAWIEYTDAVLDYSEAASTYLFHRQLAHIMLLHANTLEADHLPTLIDALQRRGYSFITVTDALTDPAYRLSDTYVSDIGTTFIDRLLHQRPIQSRPQIQRPVFPEWIEILSPVDLI